MMLADVVSKFTLAGECEKTVGTRPPMRLCRFHAINAYPLKHNNSQEYFYESLFMLEQDE
jgi:hypothetical protein